MKNNSVIDFLKLRASYGLTGSDQLINRRWLFISEYVSGTGYGFGTDQLTAIAGRQEGAMANPDVTWEKARKLNIGMEVTLWRNLLSASVDVFREKRNDILITRGVIPDLLGVSAANLTPANMGVIVNRGIELELNHRHRIGKVTYSVRAKRFVLAQQNTFQRRDQLPIRLSAGNRSADRPDLRPYRYRLFQ